MAKCLWEIGGPIFSEAFLLEEAGAGSVKKAKCDF